MENGSRIYNSGQEQYKRYTKTNEGWDTRGNDFILLPLEKYDEIG